MSGFQLLLDKPSDWVCRWAPRIPRASRVLDLACGAGRHTVCLAGMGFQVDAVDRDGASFARLGTLPGVTTLLVDLEAGVWPYPGQRFAGIIVTNYLHRPLFATLVESVAAGGVLIYETFAAGNERFGRPSNPAFLLRPGELLEAVRGHLRVVAYEDLEVDTPKPAMMQRICAVRTSEVR
jgi:SAM-dependent methyltransferase